MGNGKAVIHRRMRGRGKTQAAWASFLFPSQGRLEIITRQQNRKPFWTFEREYSHEEQDQGSGIAEGVSKMPAPVPLFLFWEVKSKVVGGSIMVEIYTQDDEQYTQTIKDIA